jgi:hypothetical protein
MSAQEAGSVARRPPAAMAAAALGWPAAAVGATAAAGILHLVTAVQHGPSGDLVVGFFLLTAGAQLGLAAWLAATWATTRSPRLLAVAAAGTAALVLLYPVAHTSTLLTDLGLVPVGHDSGGHSAGHDGGAGHAATPAGPVAMGGEVPGSPEPTTPLGAITVATEVVALAGLLALLPVRWRARAVDVLAVAGAAAWALWFTGVLS